MNIEDLISQYLDGTLSSEAEAELHHRLSVSPEARKIFKAQIALQGIARDARVLHTPTVQMRNALFDRLQREEGMGSLTDPATVTPSLLEPANSAFASRFIPPNKPTVRSELATTPERERRRRRLVALLLPLLVLVIASGIVWQRGGFWSNETEPSLAGNNTTQKGMGSGNDTLPQTTPQLGNEVSSWTRTEPSVTEKIGEELLAANQPGASSPREDHVAFKNESSREQRHSYSIGETTREATTPFSLSGTVEDGVGTIAVASDATEESEISGRVLSSFDDERSSETRIFNANEHTAVLNGSDAIEYRATPDTLKIPARDFFAEGRRTTDPESPLDWGDVSSNSSPPPSGSPILMGPTPTISLSSTQSDSAAGYDRVFTNSAPPPPPIAADLHGINPRGVKARTSSKSLNDLKVETVAEKAKERKQSAKVQKVEGRTKRGSVANSSQGSLASVSSRIGAVDILGLSGNRLTFTELATKRLLLGKAVTHNAQLQLNLDTTVKIQGTLVEQGERKRVRGGTQLPYEVVDGKVVIDISALPAEQRQQLQDYLRKLGKAE